jgi:tol-pal system protein YbgF
MTPSFIRAAAVVLAGAFSVAGGAHAQTSGARPGGFLEDLFGGGQPSRGGNAGRSAQMSDADLVTRLDRLESYLRQLTGAIEQLQFRNQQLEQAMRKMQEDTEYRFQEMGGRAGAGGARPGPAAQQPMRPPPAPSAAPPPAAPPQPGRRSDVFDPTQHPDAPGAPRALGGGGMVIAGTEPDGRADLPPVGIAGGREVGAPLDLSTVGRPGMPEPEAVAGQPVLSPDPTGPGGLPPPPPRNLSGTGAVAAVQPPTQAPSAAPKDEFDLAYGYMLRKDYALAEQSFQNFLKQHPGDRRAAEATYWLGESMFQRQRYRDAAESFLAVTTKHEKSGKAPESLYRLGQSLAALGERDAACAALAEVGRKYPRATGNVKQGVDREQKRVRC